VFVIIIGTLILVAAFFTLPQPTQCEQCSNIEMSIPEVQEQPQLEINETQVSSVTELIAEVIEEVVNQITIQECKARHIYLSGNLSKVYINATTQGVSMQPFTFEGDNYFKSKVKSGDELEVGDIISFCDEGEGCIGHRIVEIKNGVFSTKGDNNRVRDMFPPNIEDIAEGDVYKVWMAMRGSKVVFCAE